MAYEEELGQNPTIYELRDSIVNLAVRPKIPKSWEIHKVHFFGFFEF